ncbi:MAG: hypothetical protein L0Y36_04265, partial [Planctomycetales bacterium]|nr:hypothetical protein [Planctomycetales bacterium]
MAKQTKISNAPDDLLAALQAHEEVIGRFYQVCAGRFSDDAPFWSALAAEEARHAGWLERLRGQLKDFPEIVIVERFSVEAIRHSIDYVNKLIERAGHSEFERINALSLAMKLEEALIEGRFFEVIEGEPEEVRTIYAMLQADTQRHFQTIRQ